MLMDDAMMGEVLIPDDELATGWRAALTADRDALAQRLHEPPVGLRGA